MDHHKHTTLLHEFLIEQGLIGHFLGGRGLSLDELYECSKLVKEARRLERYATIYPSPTSGPMEMPRMGMVKGDPGDIIYLLVTASSISDRLRGLNVDWSHISYLWRKLVETSEKPHRCRDQRVKKKEFKSIW